MDYKLVFDLQSSDIPLVNYLYLLPGIVIFIIGTITYFFRDYFTNPFRKKPMPQRFPFFLLLFGALWMQLSAFSLYSQYNIMDHALKTGKVNVVEGTVAHFEPIAYPAHQLEHFCVRDSDACFNYSDYIVTPGFNQTSVHGGPIREGLPVRITYKDNTILKLEIATQNAAYAQKMQSNGVPPEASLSPAR